MSDYKGGPVVSVRMTTDLLEALRDRAREDGRTLSGEVVFLVSDQLKARTPPAKPLPITGWLRDAPAPSSRAELRSGRALASRQVAKAVAAKARKR